MEKDMGKIYDELREIIAEIIEVEPDEIEKDSHFVMDFGADSMMALEILASIEKKYKIIIPEEELPNMITMEKIIGATEKYISRKGRK
jgi:acyl carrier protein